MSCSGSIVMTFNEDGSFDRAGDVTCLVAGLSGSGRIVSTGQWTATDTTITILGASSSGTMELGGRTVPLPDAFGDGTAEYAIDGDALEISFTAAAVGTINQTYTRA